MSQGDAHRSYMDFRDLDPVTKRVVRSIERIKDLDDPDRATVKKNAIGHTIAKLRGDLGTADPENKTEVLK